MADVFISYAREDLQFVRRLAGELEKRGWSVWWDRSILPGRDFQEVIEQALLEAACVVVLWSSWSVRSDWVREEAAEGRERGVLVPATLDESAPPFGFRRLHSADLSTWDGIQDGHGELLSVLAAVEALVERRAPELAERHRERRETGATKGRQPALVHAPARIDPHGFLTRYGLEELVRSSRFTGDDERVSGALMIFKTPTQHTWLMATERQLLCMLDDDRTRGSNNVIQWVIPIAKARPVTVRRSDHGNAVIDIGPHHSWLYSDDIFPDPSMLAYDITCLIG